MMQTAEIETARPVIRIVDDDEVFLASQKFFFETFFPEVRVWPCAERFLDEEDLSAPGCLILDYRMPDRSGLEVQRALLLRRKPMLPIIFLSAHGDIGTAPMLFKNLASIRFWLRRSFLRVRKTPWSSEHDHQTSALGRHFGIISRPLLVRASGNPRRSRCNCRRSGIGRLECSGFCA